MNTKLPTAPTSLRRRRLCARLATGALLPLSAAAQQPPSLAFSLKIVRPTNAGPTTHVYDPAALTALGDAPLRTHVPWDAEPHRWDGVRIKRLLATHQIAGRPLRVKALNDYAAVIPWSDIEQFDPLLAWHRDGQPIAVRDKGPLLVIYPFAAHPELRRAEYTDRSVWHVNEIVVE